MTPTTIKIIKDPKRGTLGELFLTLVLTDDQGGAANLTTGVGKEELRLMGEDGAVLYALQRSITHFGTLVPAMSGETAALAPHMRRVAVERQELDAKIAALSAFISGKGQELATPRELMHLTDQLDHMSNYSKILTVRLNESLMGVK